MEDTLRAEITADPSQALAEWKANMELTVDGVLLENVLRNGDYAAVNNFRLTGLCNKLELARLVNLENEADREQARTLVAQSVMLYSIHNSMPPDVCQAIEGTARKIADSILSGNTTFEELDIPAIGEEVMMNCQSEDLDSLAGNLSTMLPMLASQMQTFPQ